MNKPKNKWWGVTKFDIGRELANPDYVQWAYERIAALEADVAKFTCRQQHLTQVKTTAKTHTPEGEICRCEKRNYWFTYRAEFSAVNFDFCPSCGKLLLT